MSFFDVIEQHGNWAFFKILARMLAFFILQQIRLVFLFIVGVIEGAMKRVDIANLAAGASPAPPQPPPDTRVTPTPAHYPGDEDLAYAAA